MGIHQLRKAEGFQLRRQKLATFYDHELEGLPIILPPHAPKGDLLAWHLYVIRLTDDVCVSRDDFIRQMADKGIGCSVHFIPLHLHPYWRDTYALKPEDFPHALCSYEHAVSLPLYTKMTDADASRVVAAIKTVLSGR